MEIVWLKSTLFFFNSVTDFLSLPPLQIFPEWRDFNLPDWQPFMQFMSPSLSLFRHLWIFVYMLLSLFFTHSLSLSLSLSHTHTHIHTRRHAHTHTHTHAHTHTHIYIYIYIYIYIVYFLLSLLNLNSGTVLDQLSIYSAQSSRITNNITLSNVLCIIRAYLRVYSNKLSTVTFFLAL